MANQEHLDILRQGVKVWNQWRKENVGIRPDLSDADLTGANLRETKLMEANLNRADLRRADLYRALQLHFLGSSLLARKKRKEAQLLTFRRDIPAQSV